MVTLQPMTEDEYNVYIPHLREEYAAERAQAENNPLEEERKASDEQIAGLLPQGLRTPDHFLWRIVAEGGARVGVLWVNVRPVERRAFIYDIELDAAQRGKGYGEAAMHALEERLRSGGITHIGLSVFGHNTVARALYDKMGYRVAGAYMLKRIASDAE